MASLQTVKKELRNRIKHVLSDIPKESISRQSAITTKNLISLPEYQAAKTLSVYLSMPSGEVQTADIVRDAFSRGKRVYVPYIHRFESPGSSKKSSIIEMLDLRSIEDFESLQPDKWGIPSLDTDSISSRGNCLGGHGLHGPQVPTPKGEAPGLDFIVMPGMAFDEGFQRLGHGRGYYDHFVTTYRRIMKDSSATREPYLAALSLHEQLLPGPDKVPVAEHDCLVDALVVGDGRILTRKA